MLSHVGIMRDGKKVNAEKMLADSMYQVLLMLVLTGYVIPKDKSALTADTLRFLFPSSAPQTKLGKSLQQLNSHH